MLRLLTTQSQRADAWGFRRIWILAILIYYKTLQYFILHLISYVETFKHTVPTCWCMTFRWDLDFRVSDIHLYISIQYTTYKYITLKLLNAQSQQLDDACRSAMSFNVMYLYVVCYVFICCILLCIYMLYIHNIETL